MKKIASITIIAALALVIVACTEQFQGPTPATPPERVTLNKPIVIQDSTGVVTYDLPDSAEFQDVLKQGSIVVGTATVSKATAAAPVPNGTYDIAFVNTNDSTIETQLLDAKGQNVRTISQVTFPLAMRSIPIGGGTPTPWPPVQPCNLSTCVSDYMAIHGPYLQGLANSLCITVRTCIACECPAGTVYAYVMIAIKPNSWRCRFLPVLAAAANARLHLPVAP